jgi:ATP/maltotriose-dependent transcriptional regulator MalT
LGSSLGNQALILQARGELGAAMALLKQQDDICRELVDREGLATSLANQAQILWQQGKTELGAEKMTEAFRTFRELGMPVEGERARKQLRELFGIDDVS